MIVIVIVIENQKQENFQKQTSVVQ